MVPRAWLALLVLPLAGCLQASVDGPVDPPVDPDHVPVIEFWQEEDPQQLIMSVVEAGFEWDTLALSASIAGTQVTAGRTDGEAQPVALVPGEPRLALSSSQQIMAGDSLRFCATDGPAGPVLYSIFETTTNTLVFEAEFGAVEPCA